MSELNLNIDIFLKDYWQKKPLLIKKAITDFKDPISPEELAGLACEDALESRIIFNRKQHWEMKNGPFKENDFTSLPEHDWTLLVQAVDPWFPQVKKLIDYFHFIPSWRIDDVLVSYAEKNAGAGPHFDYYDVFIIQGQGTRTWRIGQSCNSRTELITDSGLNLLKEFKQQEEWQLSAGDILYIPPGIAHYGISNDSSLSYSIGFRAPSNEEMLISFSDEICSQLTEDQRYSDSDLLPNINAGEINSSVIQQVEHQLRSAMDKPAALTDWFGKFMTETKLPGIIAIPDIPLTVDSFKRMLEEQTQLVKHPAARTAWLLENNSLRVFADGEVFTFKAPSKEIIALNKHLNDCAQNCLDVSPFINYSDCLDLLCQLYNQGTLSEKE